MQQPRLEVTDHVFYPVIRRTHGGIESGREDRCFTCDAPMHRHRRTYQDVLAKYGNNLSYMSVSIHNSPNVPGAQEP